MGLIHAADKLCRRRFFKCREWFTKNFISNTNPVRITDQTAPFVICCILCNNLTGVYINNYIRGLILQT